MTQFLSSYSANSSNIEHMDKLSGATQILSIYQSQTSDWLKSAFISFDRSSVLLQVKKQFPEIYYHPDDALFNRVQYKNYEPQCFDNLYQHLRYLQLEFIGQSELSFYHTLLIVLIRRGYQTPITFGLFEALWQEQESALFKQLSLRWLVSAADTFIDFSCDPTRQAIFLNVPTLINTLKVYETKLDLLTDNTVPNPAKVQVHQQQHLALYDGLRYFRLGTDDTLHNMRQRYQKFAQVDPFACKFLLGVFDRLQNDKTAFALMRQYHQFDWCIEASCGK